MLKSCAFSCIIYKKIKGVLKMNSACIIAACAAGAHNRQKKNHNMYTQYFDKNFEIYYKVNFRMYLHFLPITYVKHTNEVYLGSIYAPYNQIALETVCTEPKSIAKQHSFTIRANKCPNGPEAYIKDNLEKFTSSDIWKQYKEELINVYLVEMQEKYNIIIDRTALDYTEQFCWNIECVGD
jgi:hypothetical protein